MMLVYAPLSSLCMIQGLTRILCFLFGFGGGVGDMLDVLIEELKEVMEQFPDEDEDDDSIVFCDDIGF